MTVRYHIVQASGELKAAYTAIPDWFNENQLLVVCLDSLRDLRKAAEFLNRLPVPGRFMGDKYLLPVGAAGTVFTTDGFFCGFDAVYLFPPAVDVQQAIPQFDATTEQWDFSEQSVPAELLVELLAEIVRCGSSGFVADGCGLFLCVADRTVAEVLVRKLAGASFREASFG
jgi:hypothetical protein